MLHLAGDVQALSTHVRSDCPQCELDSAKQRQDTIATMIPCLYLLLLTVLRTPSAELPVNKKRTQTLFHKESGSSTNCMVGQAGLEPAITPL